MALLFLDFDGVLHRCDARTDAEDADFKPFSCLPRLETVLRDYPTVRVVIASDWRKHYTLAELRRLFSEDIRFRIAGVIGVDPDDHELGNRQRLVERYLADNAMLNSVWIALDDDDGNYLAGAPLILCDDGFREIEERALRDALDGADARETGTERP